MIILGDISVWYTHTHVHVRASLSLSTAVDVRHELDPVLVRLEVKGGSLAPRCVVAQPVIVLQTK